MAEAFSVTNGIIDPLLADVVTGNQDKVVGWMKGEPGAWGFLAGQAVYGTPCGRMRAAAWVTRNGDWSGAVCGGGWNK